MAQNRDQFALVAAGLRERLRSGAHVQGEPLTVNDLASAFGGSATPVREALARLAGEGLVEDRRGRGYFAWRLDVSDLIDLYWAQKTPTLTVLAALVLCTAETTATAQGRALAPATVTSASILDGRIEGALFWEALTWRVAREAGHRFLLGAQHRRADRLAPARRMEPMVFLEDIDALNSLADQVNRRAWRALGADILPSSRGDAQRRALSSMGLESSHGCSPKVSNFPRLIKFAIWFEFTPSLRWRRTRQGHNIATLGVILDP